MIKKLKYFILAVLCFIFTFISTTSYVPLARAESTTYITTSTKVLEDLERSKSFKKDDFVEDLEDYSLKLITICEGYNSSDENVLFVYVHQPSANIDIKATSINISKTTGENLSYNNYYLEFLDSEGVFFKYVVKNFLVENVQERLYDISSIFREYNKNYGDKESVLNNTISEVSFSVAKEYTISGSKNNFIFNVRDVEFIPVDKKYVGFMRYKKSDINLSFLSDNYDVHYVAFSTKRTIGELKEVDIFYKYDVYYQDDNIGIQESKDNPDYAYLSSLDGYTVGEDFWLSNQYQWNAIESSSSFITGVETKQPFYSGIIGEVGSYDEIKENVKSYISECDWVVRFLVTDYSYIFTSTEYLKKYTTVKDVTLLRLKFISGGKTYNLGVLDNKQSGSNLPDNENSLYLELKEEIKVILAIVLLLAFIVICFPLIKLLFKVIFVVLKFIFFDVLLAPVWWFFSLFER